MADNTANNDTACESLQDLIRRCNPREHWSCFEQRLLYVHRLFSSSHVSSLVRSCLAHVVNLAIVDFMSHITKIAAVENATAIWEYDPTLEGNRVLNGSLDIISAIRTLAIKASPFFVSHWSCLTSIHRSNLLDSGLSTSKGFNFSAGSRSHSRFPFMETHVGGPRMACSIEHIPCVRCVRFRLCFRRSPTKATQAIKLFVASADELYGPMTVIRWDGRIQKKFPGPLFNLKNPIGLVCSTRRQSSRYACITMTHSTIIDM